MKWIGRRQSTNVEDRRGMSRGGMLAGGGLMGIVIIVVAMLFGVDPTQLLQQVETTGTGEYQTQQTFSPEEEQLKEFTAVVLADTEDIWGQLFAADLSRTYEQPILTLYSGYVSSACGQASSASGPFYCPSDQRVYIDLSFFAELEQRFRAAGDFAQAYVVAHEVGHHVQNQLGILEQVHSRQSRVSEEEANRLSVRNELQADFLAGLWAHHAQRTKNILEPGDIEEALNAATAIGDDRLQKQTQGYIVPDSFTHGTSAQRTRWFRLGFETGDLGKLMEPFEVEYEQL